MTESSTERPRLMALVFALRLAVVGMVMLGLTAGVFAAGLTESREWESLLVLFSIFVILVAYVLLFIRFSRHSHRLLLLTPALALILPDARWVTVGFWITGLFVLEATRRESGGLFWFLLAQVLLGIGGGIALFVPNPGAVLAAFWVVCLLTPVLLSAGCWSWQKQIKDELVLDERDEAD